MKVEECRSCRAKIVWLKTPRNKVMPVNASSIAGALCSSPSGKHDFTPDIEYDPSGATKNCESCGVDAAEFRQAPLFEFGVHISHFATCPQAKKWKGKKR